MPSECCNFVGVFSAVSLTQGLPNRVILPREEFHCFRGIGTTDAKLLEYWSFNIFSWSFSYRCFARL